MPPQPLNKVRSKAKVFASPDAIGLRPTLAPMIAEIVGRWADIEANVGSILAFLLHAEAGATIAMLQAVRGASIQIEMVASAGKTKLVDPELEIFEAVIKIARSAGQKRNRIAHHIWGYCDELPDALLLIEPSAYLDIFVAVSEALRDPAKEANNPRFEPDKSKVLIYREPDFAQIIAELKIVAKCTTYLINYLHEDHPARDQLYGLLISEPLLLNALSADRKSRPPTPEPEPEH